MIGRWTVVASNGSHRALRTGTAVPLPRHWSIAQRSLRVVAILLCLLALPARKVVGELPAGAPSGSMTADEAAAYALTHNARLRALRAQIGIADGQVISASLLENPAIGAAYLRERERAEAVTRSRGVGLSISQSFGLAGQRLARARRARAAREKLRLEIVREEHRLVRDVKIAIADFYFENADSELDRVFTDEAQKTASSLGDGRLVSDPIRAQMDFRLHEITDVDDLKANRARYALNLLIGLPPDVFIAMKDRTPVAGIQFLDYTVKRPDVILGIGDLSELPPLQTETLEPEDRLFAALREVFRDRLAGMISGDGPPVAELAALLQAVHEARQAIDLVERERIPGLELFADHEKMEGGGVSAVSTARGAASSLPIFDRKQGELLGARADLEARRLDLEAARQQLLAEAHQFIVELDNLYRVHLVMVDLSKAFPTALARTEADYREGKADLEAFLGLRWRYRQFLSFHYEILGSYVKGQASLEYLTAACGFPVAPDERRKRTSWLAATARKLGTGVVGALSAPLELPASIYVTSRDRGLLAGALLGPLQGLVNSGERLGTGVFDVATSPISYPISDHKPAGEPVELGNPFKSTLSYRIAEELRPIPMPHPDTR